MQIFQVFELETVDFLVAVATDRDPYRMRLRCFHFEPADALLGRERHQRKFPHGKPTTIEAPGFSVTRPMRQCQDGSASIIENAVMFSPQALSQSYCSEDVGERAES